jgi:orsellinic acid C2-O-methyltransferase
MTDVDARARVMEMITACWTTKVLGVAAELRLPDLMAEGALTSSALAAKTGSQPDALRRLLRAMAVLGLCRQTGEDRFELTEAGEILRAGAPGSLRGMALHWGDRLWGALSELDQSVRTGKPWRISGVEGFEHMASDPGQMAMFHQSMADQTGPMARAMLDAYDFGRFVMVMDVGGGYGALLAALLKAHPGLQGRVVDLADLKDASGAYLESQGVADRGAFVGSSFFDGVPAGADAYVLKSIIHDWDDEHALKILNNCRSAAAPSGRVLLIERIAPERAAQATEDYTVIRGDILMLTANGGQERTLAEYEALFSKAGLKLDRVVATASGFSILETLPA